MEVFYMPSYTISYYYINISDIFLQSGTVVSNKCKGQTIQQVLSLQIQTFANNKPFDFTIFVWKAFPPNICASYIGATFYIFSFNAVWVENRTQFHPSAEQTWGSPFATCQTAMKKIPKHILKGKGKRKEKYGKMTS